MAAVVAGEDTLGQGCPGNTSGVRLLLGVAVEQA